MKVGLVARGNNRGLGILSREFARNMQPDRTLLVQPDAARDAGLQLHSEWFDPDAMHTGWAHDLDEKQCRKFCAGLDVIVGMETFYDWRLCDWARDEGARTVCWAMPEYFKHLDNPYNRFPKDLPWPDQWWNPTCWRQEHMPKGTRVVPVPIATDRFPRYWPTLGEEPPTWLHVVGARTQGDRNGTNIFLDALKLLKQEHRVIFRSQGDAIYPNGSVGRHVHVETHTTELAEYWDLYGDYKSAPPVALVMPRRYGGLCMPALEAMGAGLALVMPDVEPQRSSWPIIPILSPEGGPITTSAGKFHMCAPEPADLARRMDWHAKRPSTLRAKMRESRTFAEANSWDALRPTIVAELERVVA